MTTKAQTTIDNEEAKKEEATESAGPRIRIKIRAYDNKIIDNAVKTIVDTAERNNAKIVGPVPLPTEKNKYSVNRSTFVHRTSGEQYEMRTHKRLIDILNPTPKAIDALMNLNLPSGVDVEIKMS
ncbi:30S ribosomal protein S10 [Patescibacteria group bacterium]|nr:30S ribosomal protein S10 [Patescibacteria group bacterium]MBU1895773.1 30S ribosomal protein S10 [Patescibacteria group bacterium]